MQRCSKRLCSVKSGVVRCIAERAIRVSSSDEARDAEFITSHGMQWVS